MPSNQRKAPSVPGGGVTPGLLDVGPFFVALTSVATRPVKYRLVIYLAIKLK